MYLGKYRMVNTLMLHKTNKQTTAFNMYRYRLLHPLTLKQTDLKSALQI